MIITFQLIFLFASLIGGAISIFFAHQLMKRYREPAISSYFYYLIFLYIFGAYSLVGSGILERLFTSMETDEDIIHSARLFNIILGIPFLALAKFMMIRSMLEFLRKSIRPVYSVPYFLVSMAALVLYGISTVRLTWLDLGSYPMLLTIQYWTFIAFMTAIYLLTFLITHLKSRKEEAHRRIFIRRFGILYIIYMLLCCSALFLVKLHAIVPYIFIFLFLSWHLIPILFFNIYLDKYQTRTTDLEEDFEILLTLFVEKFDISKREREVITLICKGLSNQEIGESLYISLQTVKDHIHHIFIKTGVKNRVQLTNLIRTK